MALDVALGSSSGSIMQEAKKGCIGGLQSASSFTRSMGANRAPRAECHCRGRDTIFKPIFGMSFPTPDVVSQGGLEARRDPTERVVAEL